jgi:hypothetical protein
VVSQNNISLYAPISFVVLSVNSSYEQEAEEVVPSELAVQKAVGLPLAPPKNTEIQLSKEFKKKHIDGSLVLY